MQKQMQKAKATPKALDLDSGNRVQRQSQSQHTASSGSTRWLFSGLSNAHPLHHLSQNELVTVYPLREPSELQQAFTCEISLRAGLWDEILP